MFLFILFDSFIHMNAYIFICSKFFSHFFSYVIFFIYFHVIYSVSVPQSTNKPTNHLNVPWITNDVFFSGREFCYCTTSTTTTTTPTMLMMIAFGFDLLCDVADVWCLTQTLTWRSFVLNHHRCCESFYLSFATRVHRYGFGNDILTIWYGDFGQSVHRQANEFVQMFWFCFVW